jgi:RNA polymerase sigma-54 factor
MKNKQRQEGSLRLKFVPYLTLRSKLFEMNLTDLNDFVNEIVVTNPFIEEDRMVPLQNAEWERYVSQSEDMYSNLLHQLRMLDIDKQTEIIAEFIINNLDEKGYFTMSLEKVAKNFHTSLKQVERALKKVQELEPPGIGARNIQECFLLQLMAEENPSPKIKHIIMNHLEELANDKFADISKKTGVSEEFLKGLKEKLSHFTAAPGFAFKQEKIKIVVPDIIIKQIGTSFEVFLNRKFRRSFHIKEDYLEMIKNMQNGKAKKFRQMAENAKWIAKSVEERDSALFKIGQFIVQNETEFLSSKIPYPRKHTFEKFAEYLNSDISSVTRLMQNKFVETPVGIYPLRYFVQHKARDFNDERLKIKIKEIIDSEDKKHPLSDEEIAKEIVKLGINVKRRTITKYRKILGIPSSNKRRID